MLNNAWLTVAGALSMLNLIFAAYEQNLVIVFISGVLIGMFTYAMWEQER